MALCQLQARPELYGLGIRVAFYIAWFALILIQWLDETELADIRLLALLLSAGQIISLIVQVADETIRAADIYISLLLAAGIFFFLVPVYVWRGVTLCNSHWNVLRWSKEKQSPMFKYTNFVLLIIVSALGTWFYVTYLPGLDEECEQYGFLFAMVDLQNEVYVVFSAMLYIVILVVCFFILLKTIGWWNYSPWGMNQRRKKPQYVPPHRSLTFPLTPRSKKYRETLLALRNISNLIVFGVLVAAVELSILWNELEEETGELTTAAQTIPLLLSAGFSARVIFLHFAKDGDDSDSEGGGPQMGTAFVTEHRRTTVRESFPGRPPSARTR